MKLLERVQNELEERKQWVAKYEKALETIQTLPPEIQALDCKWMSAVGDNTIYLGFAGNDSFKALKMAGCQGFIIKGDGPNDWDARQGKLTLPNGITINCSVWRVDKPPHAVWKVTLKPPPNIKPSAKKQERK